MPEKLSEFLESLTESEKDEIGAWANGDPNAVFQIIEACEPN